MAWEIKVRYGNATFKLDAEKVYESSQIMRIKVYGKTTSILFENDYPFLQSTGSTKAIKWKLREGKFKSKDKQKDARLIIDIISELDYLIKGKANKFLGQIAHLKSKP